MRINPFPWHRRYNWRILWHWYGPRILTTLGAVLIAVVAYWFAVAVDRAADAESRSRASDQREKASAQAHAQLTQDIERLHLQGALTQIDIEERTTPWDMKNMKWNGARL